MEAIKISLDDFVLFGGGFNGESYDHKTDPTVMLIIERDTQCPMPQFRAAVSRVLQ